LRGMTGYVREFYLHVVKLILPAFPDGLSFYDYIIAHFVK